MRLIKILLFFYLLTFILQCSTQEKNVKPSNDDAAWLITQMVLNNLNQLPNKSIAVIEFTDINGQADVNGKLLTERIITYLAQYKEVKVVERSKVNKLVEELNLSITGLTESTTAKKIGKILNVDALLTGTLTPINDYVEINARMINTENALILSAIKVKDKNMSGTGNQNIVHAITKPQEKKSSELPRVEVMEYKLEKIIEGLNKNYSTIKITGKALFLPSQENETFKDLIGKPVFYLLDSSGNKVMEFKGGFKCGEYGNEENIIPQKPFSFTAEDGLVKKELWDNITACQFIKWTFVK